MQTVKNDLGAFVYKYLYENYPLNVNEDNDYIVFETVMGDLVSYVNYLLRKPDADEVFIEFFTRNILNTSVMDSTEYNPSPKQIKKYTVKAKKMIKDFINKWWNKWLIRGQIIFDKQNLEQYNEHIDDAANGVDTSEIYTDAELCELLEYVEDLLIDNGELCFIEEVAEDVVNGCINSYDNVCDDACTLEGKAHIKNYIIDEINTIINSDRKTSFVMIKTDYGIKAKNHNI